MAATVSRVLLLIAVWPCLVWTNPAASELDVAPPVNPPAATAPATGAPDSGEREEVVWFGGDNGDCLAYPGGIWDWDNVGADTMHCWLKTDESVISVIPEEVWGPWVEDAGIIDCSLEGNVLGFVDVEGSPYWPPGIPPGLWQAAGSGVVPRTGYEPPAYNTVHVRWNQFNHLNSGESGTYFRTGYQIYPFDGLPMWSPRLGDNLWYFDPGPACRDFYLNLSDPQSAQPIPTEWDSMRFIVEVWCSCDAFMIPCSAEGDTHGSPLIDNVQVGLTYVPDAPVIAIANGHIFHDGFGQTCPEYLLPSDVGNADIAVDLSGASPTCNDWLGDSAVVTGPTVVGEDARWLVDLCFKIERKGPRQDWIPEYAQWKARLPGDPEDDYVCVLMDSLELSPTYPYRNRFTTYFHESEPGFDAASGDLSSANEILPDGIFVPGTRIRYSYQGYWYNGGSPGPDRFVLGPYEFEILPGMEDVPGSPYDVQWPCILYVDAHNAGSEHLYLAALEQLALRADKYDYSSSTSYFTAPMQRSFGGGCFNPGGYGNNGCTFEQLLGYRLILVGTGDHGPGALKEEDFELFADWLSATECGLAGVRRGIIFDGNRVTEMMADPASGLAVAFANEVLGVTLVDPSYRTYNNDWHECILLEPTAQSPFEPLGLSLFDSDFNVLGVAPGVSGAVGSLSYYCYLGGCNQPLVDLAQVVREHNQPGVADWRSVVSGFGMNHLSQQGCAGEDCSDDSACVVAGIADLLAPMVEWMSSGADPFEPWTYPCLPPMGVENRPHTVVQGPVDHLYAARPNPFHRRASIRFHLADQGHASVRIYDATGRRVRTLVDADLGAGEHDWTWDGTTDAGRPAGAGIYWVQLRTAREHLSSMRMLRLR